MCIYLLKNLFKVCVQYLGWRKVHWKQSSGGEGNITSLACSAGDLTHHLPPGSPSSNIKKKRKTKQQDLLLCLSKQWAVNWQLPKKYEFNKVSVCGRLGVYSQNKGIKC